MDFEEWTEEYALDDEPLSAHGRYMDCKAAWDAAVKAEREACAGICDRFAERGMHPAECAGAIRMRSNDQK